MGVLNEKAWKGIYALDGDTLTICDARLRAAGVLCWLILGTGSRRSQPVHNSSPLMVHNTLL